jgi:hypothetical protein
VTRRARASLTPVFPILVAVLAALGLAAASTDSLAQPAHAAKPSDAAPSALRDRCAALDGGDLADRDGDGIPDACEQALAERFAPIVYFPVDEPNLPANVDWFLSRTSLNFVDAHCHPEVIYKLLDAPRQADLLNHIATGDCIAGTIRSDGTRSIGKRRTFFLADLDDASRRGSTNSQDWTTYFHAYRNDQGGITIQYWRCYGYNTGRKLGPFKFGFHGGDWEGVQIILDSNLNPVQAGFLGHNDIDYQPWGRLRTEDGQHLRIFAGWGGHTSRPANDYDATSRTVVRQESVSGGVVTWPDGHATRSGPLLNLGEKTAPLNGQVFIQYSGLWGGPGGFPRLPFYYRRSGYWGPAFNETGMGADGFIAAWCAGIADPRLSRNGVPECYPTDETD